MVERVVFGGSPHAAVTVLDAIVASGVTVARVVTQPDSRRGRGAALSATPVKTRAMDLGIEVFDNVEALACPGVDLGVVVAYGRIVPRSVLQSCPFVNVHFSLLPRWRGAAPVERAILAGDVMTGVSIMALEETLDTGPVYETRSTPISDFDTTESLTSRLAQLGSEALVDVLRRWPVEGIAQAGTPSYAHKVTSDESLIDWSTPTRAVHRQVRALDAYTFVDGRRLRVVEARPDAIRPVGSAHPGTFLGDSSISTGDGALLVTRVRPEGKPDMGFDEWLRGARIEQGFLFGRQGK